MMKLITVSGTVLVIAALASGPRLSRISCQVDRGACCAWPDSGPPEALAFRYFCEMLASVPSEAQLVEGLVEVGQQPAVLAGGEALLALVPDVPGDLDCRVTGLGEVGVHRDAVVDGGVHSPLVQQLDGLGEALHGLDASSGLASHVGPVARRAFGRDLALQVVQRLDGVVVGSRDDDALADGVRLGQVVLLLAFGVDGDLVGDHVEPVGFKRGEDRIPWRLNEFDLDAKLVGHRAGDVDVIADELAGGGIVVAERRVHAFGADPQHARRFNRVVAVAARRTARREHQRGE
jgi:hypothetical protein